MLRDRLLQAAARKRMGAPSGEDPHFSSVVLLCNFTADANDVKGKTATVFGTPAPPISSGKIGLNGTNQYLTFADHADFAFGSGDFTIEFFAALIAGAKAADKYYTLLHQNTSNNTTNSSLYCYFESRNIGSNRAWSCKWFNASSGVLVNLEEPANAVNDYTEELDYHIAIVRSGSSFKLYRNGVEKASATYAGALLDAAGVFQVGRDAPGAGYWHGWINSLRITKGVARYTAPFTPPSSFFPET